MHSLQAQAFFQVILNNGIGLAPFTDDVSRGGAERFPEWEIPASPISKLGISDAAVVLHHLTPKCGNYFITNPPSWINHYICLNVPILVPTKLWPYKDTDKCIAYLFLYCKGPSIKYVRAEGRVPKSICSKGGCVNLLLEGFHLVLTRWGGVKEIADFSVG